MMDTFASCSICFDDLLSPKAAAPRPSAPPIDGRTESDTSEPAPLTVCATPCGHVFHFACVSEWVDEHRHCPQCRQRVLSSARLVTLFFAHEKKTPGFGRRHRRRSGQPDSVNRKSGNPAAPIRNSGVPDGDEEAAVIMDMMQCQLDDLETECQKLRKALAQSEEQLRITVGELSVLEAQQDGVLDIKAISRELDMVRAEQDDLQRSAHHLREEITVLNENIRKKDLEIRQKDAAYEYLLGRNAVLVEQTETNDRIVSSLRAQINVQPPSFESLYEPVDEEASVGPPPAQQVAPQGQPPRRRRMGCCLNLCKCMQNTLIVIVILAIVIAILVIAPLMSIFSGSADK